MIGNRVPGAGKIPCRVFLCAEGPGLNESIQGVPMVGASGSDLDWVFLKRAAGIRREDVYVSNVVKWRTDEQDSDPTPDDIARDEPELLAEIIVVNPEIIVAIGKVSAMWWMQSNDVDMEKLHGIPIVCPRFPDKTLIITYHPAAGLRLPEKYYHHIYWDFEQVGRLVRGEIGVEQDQITAPFYEVWNFGPVPSSTLWAVDTEGNTEQPWGLSLSAGEGCAEVSKPESDRFGILREHIPYKSVVMHNALYDIPVLRSMGIEVNPKTIHDSMLMAYLLPWLPRGLKPLAYKLCRMEMQSYGEVLGEAQEHVAKAYLQRVLDKQCPECHGYGTVQQPYKRQPNKFRTVKCGVCLGDGTGWPLPQAQLIFNNDTSAKVYKPQSVGRRVRGALSRGTKLRETWQALDSSLRDPVEAELGPLREATLDDIDKGKAVHYSARDADATLRVYHKLEHMLKREGLWRVYEIDRGIIPIIDRMHTNGILLDFDHFRKLEGDFTRQRNGTIDRLGALVGHMINPASPTQVAGLLFGDWKLKARGGWSTDEKTLEALKMRYSLDERVVQAIDLITDYRELTKLLGTYVEPLPRAADGHGRVHTQFLLHVTTSGRLSSRSPNLQNIPTRTDNGKLIRQGFIPKPGCVLVSVDLDQIELRVAAHLAEDENMVEIFRTGQDIHLATAALIYNKPLELVTDKERRVAKTINFGILYGMSAQRLMKELNLMGITVTLEDCIGFIHDWFSAYPGVKDYIYRCHSTAKDLGYVECLFGRRRYLPGVYSTIDKVREESLRWAVNHPDQGTAAAILKLWMHRVWGNVLPTVARLGYVEPLLTVHDEVIFEVEEGLQGVLIPMVAAEAEASMELLVPITAKGGYGSNWNELK